MATKIINLKITSSSPQVGPFEITDDLSNVLGTDVSLSILKLKQDVYGHI